MYKLALKIASILVIIAVLIFFIYVPGYIDKSMNKVQLRIKNPPKVEWYDSIPFIADLHCDQLLWDRDVLKEHQYGHVDVPRMQKANMALQVFSIVTKTPRGINIENNTAETDNITLLGIAQLRPFKTWFNLTERALNQCNELHNAAKASNGKLRLITNKAALNQFIVDRTKDKLITAGMLGIEGAHALNNDLNNLDKLYEAGVRYIGITHFFDNEWAGSAHGVKKAGLTTKGISLIKKMNELKITIDLAHVSPEAIDDILKISKQPVIISHTGVQGVCNNRRNLSDKHLEAIGKRNGLVGIGLWETAVCGTNAEATAKSIRYVADKIGVTKVALGSDFDGAIGTHFDVTGLPLIVNALQKEHFTRTEIELILGGNIRDFFLANLPASN
ncbi:dipeptidase [Sediminibacterium sp.]|jgi:microsomal dipeptidase-like Zn-dependent dipeptidase|uniref:dipeptidase n=1 Tax=Sediminibacterium sp. TaxID=1917865 RepID=UPI000BCE6232|nr:dipeptidase [Sediminibacterium sp.]OYY11588.1 MAG: peptidase M19 [Sphingobacteriia bacterium 35-36-14]OYZ55292.1 MAG: peptidase M19 [Sphingobacteriia bacterium 24-36-13]OZA66252.1 MAG: peptidase M19 [Sphingobacteriia bacterium 39-36-14]MDP3392866.1 dipeptidase [Sediminibacterium sp.]MDP3565988.1 dipeptidase [Sediminibacterium sp.]